MKSTFKTIAVMSYFAFNVMNFTALQTFYCSANNLSIKSGAVSGANIIFNISWDNSWYNNTTDNPNNWDAVWVFVKYKNCDSTKWSHADVSKNSGDHVVASPLKADAVTDGKGVFLRRSAAGKGNISSVLCTLKLATITSGSYDFRIFGIEMVYVPQDTFHIGDGASNNTFNSITITSSLQSSGVTSAVLGGGTTVNVPSTYPMGYNSFYCMKYEITQEQFADFLNTLSYEQQTIRTVYAPNSPNGTVALMTTGTTKYRNFIEIKLGGFVSSTPKTPAVYGCDLNNNDICDETGDGQNIACNWLSWADLSAYLDWAALRPMSDFEFEKVCRGKVPRVDREYVWGSSAFFGPSSITQAYTNRGRPSCGDNDYWGITNTGLVNEISKWKGNGLCAYGIASLGGCGVGDYNQQGPIRVGFAADSTGSTTRVTTGSAYYGAMDMGGNVTERVVAVNTKGISFTGSLGDGKLDVNGDANQTDWPSKDGNGAGFRGGNWYDGSTYIQISDRSFAFTSDAARTKASGGRGVR